jgi:hypothetical protein
MSRRVKAERDRRHNYGAHLDDLAAAEERRWREYANRLTTNATATFE